MSRLQGMLMAVARTSSSAAHDLPATRLAIVEAAARIAAEREVWRYDVQHRKRDTLNARIHLGRASADAAREPRLASGKTHLRRIEPPAIVGPGDLGGGVERYGLAIDRAVAAQPDTVAIALDIGRGLQIESASPRAGSSATPSWLRAPRSPIA